MSNDSEPFIYSDEFEFNALKGFSQAIEPSQFLQLSSSEEEDDK
jgi:hypothetical protein